MAAERDFWDRWTCTSCGGALSHGSERCWCEGKPAPVAGRAVPMPRDEPITVARALAILRERYRPPGE
jgi:hypothetical protein